MDNKYFDKFCALIKSEAFVSSINNIKTAVSAIWTGDVRIIHDYTDHGPKHSERIFEKLYNLLWPENAIGSLHENELYILILGVILHDIGMQCDVKKHTQIMDTAVNNFGAKFNVKFTHGTANAYSKEEQNEIRKNHHLLTAAWLDCSFKGKSTFLNNNALQSVDSQYREDIINVCKFHSKLDIKECPEISRISRVRCQFLAALLRLGDEMDIDKYRVDVQTVETFSYDPENSIYWYIHNHTQIIIENHVICLKIYLTKEDCSACGKILQDIVVNKFKNKNTNLTEILIKNGVRAVIGESSGVEEDEYALPLPEQIRKLIVEIDDPSKERNAEQSVNSYSVKREKAFEERISSVRSTIEQLLKSNEIAMDELKQARELFYEPRHHRELRMNLGDEVIFIAKKALSFIQGLSIKDMEFLCDIGVGLHIQVLEGVAQKEARMLFTELSGNEQINEKLESSFWDYSYEQVWRILDDCISIICFDFDSVELSEGYVHKKITGKLLAASVSGETSNVYVWNLDIGRLEPVAALGGLYEDVYDLKVLRDKEKVFIIGAGMGKIYVWDLTSGSQPAYIFENAGGISAYSVVRSMNGKLYMLSITQRNIYLWDFYTAGDPVRCIRTECDFEDVFIVNTRLSPSNVSYALIGHSSRSNNVNNKIWEIQEKSELDFVITPVLDKETIIGATHDMHQFEYVIDSYKILPDRKVLGVLTRKALLLYDVDNKKQLALVWRKGPQAMNFDMLEIDGEIYMLVYFLWNPGQDDGKGLVRCFPIENGKATEIQHWFRNQHDILHGIITLHKKEIKIFFSEHFQGTIYSTAYNKDKCNEFFKLPETMRIIDMICG